MVLRNGLALMGVSAPERMERAAEADAVKRPRRDILVVGSVALDSVRTPFGEVVEALGGSASYFSLLGQPLRAGRAGGGGGRGLPRRRTASCSQRAAST